VKVLFKVIVLSLLTIGFFAGFSNYGIPEINPAPPPVEEELDLGSMTMERFIALGNRIFNGKGTCTLCHNAVGGRAPLLDKVVAAAPGRMADPRYKGDAGTLEAYLYESMVKPSAFVVAGFGKTGSNDTQSPMPDASAGGIALSDAELKAVIAYLQDLGGADVTVEIPSGVAAEEPAAQAKDAAPAAAPPAPAASADAIMAKLACVACHKVAGQGGEIGPDLSSIGARKDREYLRRAILNPAADVAEGYPPGIMPPNYGDQLYASELEMLVDYLAESK
jgi:mono/diheme cytochrome c family protein